MITILAIVGEAGVGKDTAASYLSEKKGWNLIHSYTNRPMRVGETQGKEHIFVEHTAPNNTFAYTHYGDYDYWTEIKQFLDNQINIYVVDEAGLVDANEKAIELGNINVIGLYISANKDKRSERGVSIERMKRDDSRFKCECLYDYQIVNDGTMDDFYKSLDSINIYNNEPRHL